MPTEREHIEQLYFSGDAAMMELALTLAHSQGVDLRLMRRQIQTCIMLAQRRTKRNYTPLSLIQSIVNSPAGVFDLENSTLEDLPEDLAVLRPILRHLDLSYNNFFELPPVVTRLERLEHLLLDSNNLQTLPEDLAALEHLKRLDVSHNLLTALPHSLTSLPHLMHISLAFNPLYQLPDNFGRLPLASLVFGTNDPMTLPPQIFESLQLTYLCLSGKGIKHISEDIGNLQRLEKLVLSDIDVADLPTAISQLRNLKQLFLWRMPLSDLSGWLPNLQQLEELSLHYTPNFVHPHALMALPMLRKVDIMGDGNYFHRWSNQSIEAYTHSLQSCLPDVTITVRIGS